MTQTASRIQSKATAAMRRVESYRKRFGDGHIYLACYAALPLALTPDLLYRLWANFQRDGQGELLEIPWIAVSDLLLSNLCEEVGEELYEMEDGIREVLLKELRSLPQWGEARLREVAEFVLAYVEPQLNSSDSDVRDHLPSRNAPRVRTGSDRRGHRMPHIPCRDIRPGRRLGIRKSA